MSDRSAPRIVIVAAVGRNGAIGARNGLPWRLPSDLKRFKAITLGKPLIMGRKTFQSIGRPLPGRETIVVTRDPGFAPAGAHVAADLDAALALAATRAAALGADEIIIAGGGEIYAQAMDRADALRLTEVALTPDADAFFPPIDPGRWRLAAREDHAASAGDEADFAFLDYERARPRGAVG